ncbi:hypothetical protein LJK88_38040 [Paenibacillus sp. P26]|nr:hypothetical protein LJK88_38040 [Paenibacillus sp. P26]
MYSYTGRIHYGHGWSWWWSLGFDVMMFLMLRLHSVKPVLAYAVSVVIIVALVLLFHVPLEQLMTNEA